MNKLKVGKNRMLNQGNPVYHQMQPFHIRTRMNNAGSPVSRYGNFEENTTQSIQPNIETEKVTNLITQR
jgi:hypothetical protein